MLNLAVSLDGYIEGPNGEYDWCFTDQDYGMRNFLNRIDTIFIGRTSYELLQNMEDDPFPGKKKYIFSNSLKDSNNSATIISGDIAKAVYDIKSKKGKDIWLFGGAGLTVSLVNLNLVDEFLLSVHPLLLGAGKPLFKGVKERINLKLTDTEKFSTGLVQLIYTPESH